MRMHQLAIALALTTLFVGTAASLAAEGRITQWLLAGPFEDQQGGKPADFLTTDPLGEVAVLAPAPGAAADQKKWVAYATTTGFINVNDKDVPVGTVRPAAFAAFVYVYSPKVQPARLAVTFSDGAVVVFNGRTVINKPDGGGNAIDGSKVDLLLGEGWNRLYVKCAWFARLRATWSFGARLTAPDMTDLAGMKLSTDNPFAGGKVEPPKYTAFIQASAIGHFGIHRVRLANISPLDLADATLVVRSKAGQKLQESKLGALKAFSETEVDINTDEVSFQQNWPGAVCEVTYTGGKVEAPLSALKAAAEEVVEYRTGCLNRMKPWAGGRVKLLLLVPGQNRQTIELVQRGDFEYHVIDTAGEPKELEKQIKEELANNKFDCIVVASQNWAKLPAIAELSAAVEGGAGLVAVTPLGLPDSMDKLLGLEKSAAAASQPGKAGKVEKGADHPVVAGVPFEALPAMAPAPLKAAEGAVVAAKVGEVPAVIAQDKQTYRTVALNFGRGSSLIWPIPRDQFLDNYRLPVWERQWSLVLKSILWAGKKDGGVTVACTVPAKATRDDVVSRHVKFQALGLKDPEASTAKVEAQARASGYAIRGNINLSRPPYNGPPVTIVEGNLTADLPAGENEIDVVVKDKDGKVLCWGGALIVVEPRGSIGKITVTPAEKDKDYFLPADDITFTVGGKADVDGLTLVGRILDNHGRCLAQKLADVKKGDFTEKFTFQPQGLLTTVGRFQAELGVMAPWTSTEPATRPAVVATGPTPPEVPLLAVSEARGEAIFFVRHNFVWDKYEPVLWLTHAGSDWYYDLDYFRLLNDVMWIPNGWSTWFNPDGPHRAMVVNAGLEGFGMESLHFFSMNHNWTNATFEMRRQKFDQTKDIRWLYRTPIDKATGFPVEKPDYANLSFGNDPYNTFFPLDDPEYREFTRKKIAAQIKGVRRYNPLTYDLMDEGSYTSYARAFDFDFSPGSVERFRAWLKGLYPDLAALNKEWDTTFKTWEEVMPMHIYQIRQHVQGKKLPSYGAWVDHRKYNDLVYNQYIRLCSDAARAAGDDDAVVGIGGGQRPNPYGGWDYWLVSNYFTWVENYFEDTTEYIRSFNTKDKKLKACPGADVWWSVKLGNVGFYRWVDTGHIRGDFGLLPRGQETGKQLEEVRGRGFSKLLYHADAADEPIGIHYSQSTVQLSYAKGGPGAADQLGNGGPLVAKLGFYNLIEELGYQFKFVSYEQLEQGHLQKAGYKLMILPESQALSDKEAAQLKDFVEKGGVLVADRWVGEWTDHGRKRDKSVLEEYFGIDPKAATDKQVGKGWVIYLGGDWPVQYWTDRQGKDVKPYWDKMTQVLAKAGIASPRARVLTADGQPARRTEIRYFELGKIRYHVISSDVPGKYTFAATAPAYVYDMRDGRYGGKEGWLEIATAGAFPALVATSPYKIDGVMVVPDSDDIQAGDDILVAAQVQSAEKPDVHALHFRVYGPDGVERRWYGDTVFGPDGKGSVKIQTALNEAKGTWTVKVADLASGLVGQSTFEVK